MGDEHCLRRTSMWTNKAASVVTFTLKSCIFRSPFRISTKRIKSSKKKETPTFELVVHHAIIVSAFARSKKTAEGRQVLMTKISSTYPLQRRELFSLQNILQPAYCPFFDQWTGKRTGEIWPNFLKLKDWQLFLVFSRWRAASLLT